MYWEKYFLNSLLFVDITIIINIFKYKNVHHGEALNINPKIAMMTHKIFTENNLRLSCRKGRSNSSITMPHSYGKVGIILNSSHDDWNIFSSLDQRKVFKSPYIWVILTNDLNRTTKVLSKYPIEVDSDITIISKTDNGFVLYEIFNTGFALKGEVIVREIGSWNGALRMEKKNRLDLKGLVMRSTIVISKNHKVAHKTFLQFLEGEQPSLTVDPMHKFKYFAVLKFYRDMFNISYVFQRSNSWGYPTNGSFDGMVGALQRFEADIGGSPLFVRIDRSKAVDYAAETWQTRPTFIFRHPKYPGGFYTVYTRPLSSQVWLCIIVILVLFTSILGLMLYLKRSNDTGEKLISTAFLFIWGAVCQQGISLGQSSTAIKMVVFVTFIFTLTLYQYYNATVVSTLLHDPPKSIRTMADLLRSDLKAGIEDELYNKDFFKRTTDPLAIAMYNKRIATRTAYNFYPSVAGMKLVKHGGFAFHVDSAVAYRIMKHTFSEQELCEVTEVSMYVPQYLGAAVTKGSPYKEHIAYGIRKMKEHGIMRRLQLQWDESRPICVHSPDSKLIAVSLQEFSTALMVLSLGMSAALLILVVETLTWKWTQQKFFPFTP